MALKENPLGERKLKDYRKQGSRQVSADGKNENNLVNHPDSIVYERPGKGNFE